MKNIALIYPFQKNAMQSGRKKNYWCVTYQATNNINSVDPLMGWSSVEATDSQITLKFDSLELALQYVKDKDISYQITNMMQEKQPQVKSYRNNFQPNRKSNWTH